MFGSHFYHATMRKTVAVFGTLFNNLTIIRKNGSGGVVNQIKVPLAYGPKQKFLARIDQQLDSDSSMAIKLPRMSFEITALDLDTKQKMQKGLSAACSERSDDPTNVKSIKHAVAYNIGMQLNVMAKNQDDGLQVLEQIIPYFQPEYTVAINPIDDMTFSQDVPIVLNSVAINDDYEGELAERRVLVYTLDFVMKMKFYGPTSESGIIKSIDVNFANNPGLTEMLSSMGVSINPTDANVDDDYTVITTITDPDNTGT
jgi:hypothetical protein